MNHHPLSRRRIVGALSAAGALAALTPASVLAQETTTLRIAYNLPKTHPTGQFFEILAQEIEKNTASTSVRMKVRTFPNGQLFNDAQLPDAISTGSVEIGQINMGFINTPDAAVGQVVNLPALWNSWEALWHAEDHEAYRSVFQALFNKLGMQMLGFAAYGTAEFYANKPVKLPSDFKGLRLRGFGGELSHLIRELGAAPVTLSSQEMYQATQRGTIDGFVTGPSSVYARKLYEVVKYSSAASVLHISFPATANLKWWAGLPKDVQAAITKAAVLAQQKGRELAKAEDQHATEQIAKLGVTIQTLTPAERGLWVKAGKPVHDKYIERVGDNGRKLMAIVQEANAKFPAR